MKYTFFKDELSTIWYRDCFTVEADTYKEAVQKAIEMIKNDEIDDIDYSEPIWETWNPTRLDDNDGFSTIELQDTETNKIVWENGR